MDEFFKKEITPFAKVKYDHALMAEKEIGLFWAERWKFTDRGLYNRAVKVSLNLLTEDSTQNWTEFQRRVKHLLAVRLELETILEWTMESWQQNSLGLINVVNAPKQKGRLEFNFWNADQHVSTMGLDKDLFSHWSTILEESNDLIFSAIHDLISKRNEEQIGELMRQFNKILSKIYDELICVCPWEGLITGGPMLPEQVIHSLRNERKFITLCSFEFCIIGARPRDHQLLKDLKFPALSANSQIWIHHGSNTEEKS